MLSYMRKFSNNITIKIIFILIAISFIFWGAGDFLKPDNNYIAKINRKHIISINEFNFTKKNEIRNIEENLGIKLNNDQIKNLMLDSAVLNKLVNRKLLELEADNLDLVVSDKFIAENIRKNPYFHNNEGKFDKNIFKNLINSVGLSELDYIKYAKNEQKVNLLIDAIFVKNYSPSSLINKIALMANEKRTIDIVQTNLTNPTPLSNEEIETYYENNKHEFKTQEYRSIKISKILPETFIDQIAVTDEDLKNEYNAIIDDFRVNIKDHQKRNIYNFIFQDELEAKNAKKIIEESQTAKEIVNKLSYKKTQDTVLENLTKDKLPKEIQEIVFSLKKGEVSEPIKTSFGWHIIKVKQINNDPEPKFSELKEGLKNKIQNKRIEEFMFETIKNIEDDIAGGAKFNEIVSKYHLTEEKSPLFDKDMNNKSGLKIDINPEFISSIFEMNEDMVDLKEFDGIFYLISIDQILLPQQIAFDEKLKSDISTKLQNQRFEKEKVKIISEVLEEYKKNKKLELSREILVKKDMLIDRNSPFEHNIIEDIYNLKIDEATNLFKTDNNQYGFAILKNTSKPEKSIDLDESNKLFKHYKNIVGNDLEIEFINMLRRLYDIKINKFFERDAS